MPCLRARASEREGGSHQRPSAASLIRGQEGVGHSRGGVPGFWVQQAGGRLGTWEFKPRTASLHLCQEAEKIDFFPEWPSLRSRGRAGPRRPRRGTLLAWRDALGEALAPHRWARPGGKGLGNAAWLGFVSFVCVI